MKKRLLVVLLVLSLVLVGCGKKDYTDIDLYKDMVVQKYKEIDKDFFKSYNEALRTVGIRKSVKNFVNSSLDFFDEYLDLLGDEAEDFYNKFETNLDQVTEVSLSQEEINEFVNEFESFSKEIQGKVQFMINSILNSSSKAMDKLTNNIKDLTSEDMAKIREDIKDLEDSGILQNMTIR